MPGSGLEKVAVLGNDTAYSLSVFKALFAKPDTMRLFKGRVSTAESRQAYRLFAKNSSTLRSVKSFLSGKTDYQAVLTDILDRKSEHGCLSHVATVRALIDARHGQVQATGGNGLGFLASTAASKKEDVDAAGSLRMREPMHRLLVEEHVLVFVWSPRLSKSYYVLKAAVAAAELASSTVATVGSLGAAVPGLIFSLQSAANSLHQVIKLKGELGDQVDRLVQFGQQIRDSKGMADEIGDAMAHLSDQMGAIKDGAGAVLAPSEQAGAAQGPVSRSMDLSMRQQDGSRKKVSSFFGLVSREETDREYQARLRKELMDAEQAIQRLNFVVVQQITPVIQVRDNFEVRRATDKEFSFDFRTFIARRAIVRVGETNRDRFNQLIAANKSGAFEAAGIANLLCSPWSTSSYLQFIRTPNDQEESLREFSAQQGSFVHWDDLSKPEWELVDEKVGTMPLPTELLKARVRMQEQARSAAQASQLQKAALIQRQHAWANNARGQVALAGLRSRADATAAQLLQAQQALTAERGLRVTGTAASQAAEHLAHDRLAQAQRQQLAATAARADKAASEVQRLRLINQALAAADIPSPETFKLQTTTRTGPFVNSRNNPKLLMIDLALLAWHDAKAGSTVASRGVEQMMGALLTLIAACDEFIASKRAKGRSSEREAPVEKIRAAATRIHEILSRIDGA